MILSMVDCPVYLLLHNNVVKLSFGHFGVQGVMDTIESHYVQLDGGVMSCACKCMYVYKLYLSYT